MGFRSPSEQLSGQEISIRLLVPLPHAEGWGSVIGGDGSEFPILAPQQNESLPPQLSPAFVALVAQFSCSVQAPDPREGVQAHLRGCVTHAVLVAGLWWVQQDGSFARAALRAVCGASKMQVRRQQRRLN